jgi:glutamine synthetase type III
MVNTVLCAMTAHAFKQISDAIEAGAAPKKVAQDALANSFKVVLSFQWFSSQLHQRLTSLLPLQAVFNGNGYDADAQTELTAKGCWRIHNGVEAICRLREPKNVALFRDLGILTEAECAARERVLLQQYTGTVELEVGISAYTRSELVQRLYDLTCVDIRRSVWWTCYSSTSCPRCRPLSGQGAPRWSLGWRSCRLM